MRFIPYKATAKERCNNKAKLNHQDRKCRICGKMAVNGKYCDECYQFIKSQRQEEKKNDKK